MSPSGAALASLAAAVSSFAVLFAAPLAVDAVLQMLGALSEGAGAERRGPAWFAHARFAAAWSCLAFIPAGLLAAATRDGGPGELPVVAAVAVAALAVAQFRLRRDRSGAAWRGLWIFLEVALVVMGFLVFLVVFEQVEWIGASHG